MNATYIALVAITSFVSGMNAAFAISCMSQRNRRLHIEDFLLFFLITIVLILA